MDELGRQPYRLLRAGDHELWNRGRPLTSIECLAFLADLPKDRTWVGYYFDYDVTQILRELPRERLEKLLGPRTGRQHFRWIDWQGFQIDYLPRKFLRVRREGGGAWTTISDTGAFFQSTFTRAIERWNVGSSAEQKTIEAGKARRGHVDRIDARERAYNAAEVRLLADLMERFREACSETGYLPRAWQGPGYLASAMLGRHELPRARELHLPEGLRRLANDAYYGGRFEVFAVGEIPGPVWSHDINSAYPRALLDLPCLVHGRWREKRHGHPDAELWIADLRFRKATKAGELVCDLPVRSKEGTITWPRRAGGVYWSWEVEAAECAGTKVERFSRSWGYERACDCRPFGWVPEVYAERKRLGKDGRGLVLKLALNSVYGKLAQSIGGAPYANPIWAGLVTAHTRAAIIRSYTGREREIVMIATDGIVSRGSPLAVEPGAELGAWTVDEHPGVFVVQPGFYFLGEKVKTRGASRRSVEPLVPVFRRAWRQMLPRRSFEPVIVPETLFTGLRLALARGKPETAGRWTQVDRRISFDWTNKRGKGGTTIDRMVITFSKRGSSSLRSVPYDKSIGRMAEMERMEREAQPDYSLGDDR